MREIKFRAWSKSGKFWINLNGFDIVFIECELKGSVYCVYEQGVIESYPIEDVELMQYTGLKDKNGKEIYEGDMLNRISYPPDKSGNYDSVPSFRKDNMIQVGFNDGCFTGDGAHLWRFISDGAKTDYEIIGNIHENPELIK